MTVLQDFTCKVTKKRYLSGEVYDGKRGEELAAKGFVEGEPAKEKKETKPQSKNKEAGPKSK